MLLFCFIYFDRKTTQRDSTGDFDIKVSYRDLKWDFNREATYSDSTANFDIKGPVSRKYS